MAKQVKVNQVAEKSWRSAIEKKHGKGSIIYLDEGAIVSCESISTGAVTLDMALGVGGIPRGRIIEIFGPESSGKTTLTLAIIANAQKAGLVTAFIDAEHALDPDWARRLGVKLNELSITQPDTGEQALDIVEMMINSGEVDLIVIDSVAALVPKAEIDGEIGDSHIGLQARMLSQACRKFAGIMAKQKCTVIFINQIREKIGVMFGNPEVTPGGRALKFYSSVRIDIRKTGVVKEGDLNVANTVKAKIIKNKVAPPFKHAELKIYFGCKLKDGSVTCSGIDGASALVDAGVAAGIIEKSGSWFNYGETRLGLGVVAAGIFVRDNPDIAKELRDKILNFNNSTPVSASSQGFDEDTGEVDDEIVGSEVTKDDSSEPLG